MKIIPRLPDDYQLVDIVEESGILTLDVAAGKRQRQQCTQGEHRYASHHGLPRGCFRGAHVIGKPHPPAEE
jgi:hypothetical protein